jgi:hypothetical protein
MTTCNAATDYVTRHLNRLAELVLACLQHGMDPHESLAEVARYVALDGGVSVKDACRACYALVRETN